MFENLADYWNWSTLDQNHVEAAVVGATLAVAVIGYQTWTRWLNPKWESYKMSKEKEKDMWNKASAHIRGALRYAVQDGELTPEDGQKVWAAWRQQINPLTKGLTNNLEEEVKKATDTTSGRRDIFSLLLSKPEAASA